MSKQTILFPQPCHEDWDRMKPEGRAKSCESCSKHVHDLTKYTPEEAEQLLSSGETPSCVRANILPDGRVLTRPSVMGRVLMAAVVTPAIALALASSAIANPLTGSIVGSVQTQAKSVKVTALGAGKRHSMEVDDAGNYHVDQLPPGSYRLVFSFPHAQTWAIENVQVTAGSITHTHSRDPRLPPLPPPPMRANAGMPMPMPMPPPKAAEPSASSQHAENQHPAESSSSK